ncbi:ABC transporter permease [Poseidonocella sp. HB161398]|uniref:cell division protein FtsX n=1 Tax=Poseidonocella sp. HB161398 TaxID=2320855 RepID=UPI00110831D4|nr:FtsX-like permease family protein [Poseidonocella sp. HB161398]
MSVFDMLRGDPGASRVVPSSGTTPRLVALGTASMAFLAVFAIALAAMLFHLGATWRAELAGTATVRITSSGEARDADTEAAMQVLQTTPGIATARVIPELEQQALLEPWFGKDLPLDSLPLPRLIEVTFEGESFDAKALGLRLAGEVPSARFDDHDRWRGPLARAQARMSWLAVAALGLIAATLAAVTALAARAALSANSQVIDVLRLVGARDTWIARAFVRRITLRAFLGACIGTLAAAAILAAFPATGAAGLPALRPSGASWALLAPVPLLAALVAWATTRRSALRMLKGRP